MGAVPILLVLAIVQAPPDPTKLLGGPCADPANHELLSTLSRQFDAAMKRSDFVRAAEIGPQLVRAFCANDTLWWRYAEALVRAGRLADAVAVFEYLIPRNETGAADELMRPGNPFGGLAASRQFRESLPGRRLAQILLEAEQRRSEARARLAGMARPPQAYVAKKICPFECCHYGQWKVTSPTVLFDAPGGSTAVASLRPGETIEALDGEVHLKPAAVLVRQQRAPEAPFPAGAIVFLAGYTGEGWGRVWYEGREVEAEVSGAAVYCPSPGRVCWGEFLDPADQGWAERAVWWIRIKAPNGRIGWTSEPRNFSGADGCG